MLFQLLQRRHFLFPFFRRNSIGFCKKYMLCLFHEFGAIGFQFTAYDTVIPHNVVGFGGNQMEKNLGALYVPEKFNTEALAAGGTLDDARNIGEDNPVVRAKGRLTSW